ncbi:MAG: ABC transporter permease subunit [Bacteroidota bacterium]
MTHGRHFLRSLVAREILENFLSARFVIMSLVSVALIVTTIFVLTASYEGEHRDYLGRVRQQDQFIDQFGHHNRLGWMSRQMRPPSHLQVLVLGIDRESQQENFISNPVAALLSRLDFSVIVTIIFSLMAMLFSYDAISGEREAGTLRLLLASGASRHSIVLGKFLGGLAGVLIPPSIAALAGFLVIALSPAVQLTAQDFVVFGVLLFGSWLYIAVFVALGILFSARSRTSGQSILKSLFVWVVLVLVIPNISPFLAAELYSIPSAAKIEQETFLITDRERDEILRKRWKEMVSTKYADLNQIIALGRPEIEARLAKDASLRSRYDAYSREYEDLVKQVNLEQRKKAEKVSETFQERSKRQEQLAKTLTSLSPSANFAFVATDLTETGIEAVDHWARQAGEYNRDMWRYAETRYTQEKEKNPAFDWNDYLDLRARPRFEYRPSGVGDRIAATAPNFGVLFLFGFVFLAGALASFQRYDVR